VAKFKVPLVDLRAQYEGLRSEIDAAIRRVIETSSFILGPEVEAFEREFAAYCETQFAVACGNGTDAITLALEALGVRRGDEVITVAHTFFASAEAIGALGARPVFVDIRPDTLLMDTGKIEAAITPRTRAILAVHLYGQMVEMDPVLEIATRNGLKVVEDAAQAHGARYQRRRAGTIGDAGCFSFYPGKNLGAYGDAGAIVTNDAEVADWMRKARNHGRTSKYEHEFEARSSRMDGLQGAVLRVKLPRLDGWNDKRRQLAREYRALLQRDPSLRHVEVHADCEPVFHLFVVQTPKRDQILDRLQKAGFEAGIHYPVPLHRQRAYAHLESPALPVTERAAREVLSLPLFPELDTSDLKAIAAIVDAS
jgi:dTDP-4-amino-4,6-dideoxygalactose transaminase